MGSSCSSPPRTAIVEEYADTWRRGAPNTSIDNVREQVDNERINSTNHVLYRISSPRSTFLFFHAFAFMQRHQVVQVYKRLNDPHVGTEIVGQVVQEDSWIGLDEAFRTLPELVAV